MTLETVAAVWTTASAPFQQMGPGRQIRGRARKNPAFRDADQIHPTDLDPFGEQTGRADGGR